MKKIIILLLLFTILMSGCKQYCPPDDYQTAKTNIVNMIPKFLNAVETALSGSRNSMDSKIEELKAMKTENDNNSMPGCLEKGKTRMSDYMNSMITALTTYRDTGVLDTSDCQKTFNLLADEIRSVTACYPNCQP